MSERQSLVEGVRAKRHNNYRRLEWDEEEVGGLAVVA